MAFENDYPELAAMFQALQDGLKAIETGAGHDDIWYTGAQIRSEAMGLGGWSPIVAAGLRMVADAIDPPASDRLADQEWIDRNNPKLAEALAETRSRIEAEAELKHDVAEMLAHPKLLTRPCVICGSLTHLTIAHPKRPNPCLCGNQPTHERDVCPFEPPEAVSCSCWPGHPCLPHREELAAELIKMMDRPDRNAS